jgi:hypothetical protein
MAENKLNVRLGLKYDTYENWKKNNPVLLAGEVAFTTVPQSDASGVSRELPAVLAKVGDGTTPYNQLPFLMAKAADVSEWAKAEDKPEYTAEEISGLSTFVSDLVSGEMGVSIDTDTQYTITKINDYQYKLMAKGKGDGFFTTEVATLDIPRYDDSAINGRVDGINSRLTTAESEIDALQGQVSGLTGAMHFKGTITTDPTTITSGYSSGDVVLYNKKEYVFDSAQSKFIELGDEGSLITREEVQTKVNTAETNAKNYADAQIEAFKTDLILVCGNSNITGA